MNESMPTGWLVSVVPSKSVFPAATTLISTFLVKRLIQFRPPNPTRTLLFAGRNTSFVLLLFATSIMDRYFK